MTENAIERSIYRGANKLPGRGSPIPRPRPHQLPTFPPPLALHLSITSNRSSNSKVQSAAPLRSSLWGIRTTYSAAAAGWAYL
jgi:hypothetical protein